MEAGIRERWILLSITLLGSGVIIGSEINRLPPEPAYIIESYLDIQQTIPDTPLVLTPRQDANQAIAKVMPILEVY